ncbi:hypothetical protein N7510_009062 [Penicillium lagena]|uniref:uncharacterized protein n=1 Tax=Penicillium lagena TaxID=94218 RepID=UPI002541AE30|nr:uncharacterized protein N7510_009062 [Penicillium lagena]KAJ5606281.1 hypothetical protein N7510_009062 [Penicillium lagena]
MAMTTMRRSPEAANGGSIHPSDDHRYGMNSYGPAMPPQVPRTRSVSSRGPLAAQTAGQTPGRSFSARARDLPPGSMNYTTRKPVSQAAPMQPEESNTPRGMPPAPLPPGSNTTASTAEQRRGWASDRSPLQKLEVTLTGITKEEKRARVQEAEMKARERLARQKAEREKAESMAAAAQAEQNMRAAAVAAAKRKEIIPEPRSGSTAVRHSRALSMNPQYPAVHRAEDPQYARTEDTISPTARTGGVPRKLVAMGVPVAKPDDNVRSISQADPRVAAPMLSEERMDENQSPTQTFQDSVDSQPRPKKQQTVSFDVPPPTPPPIFEWRNPQVARLGVSDFDFQHLDADRSKAWWEGGGTTDRRKSRALPKNYQTPAQKLSGVNEHKTFQPPLFLKCGPLIRYTGMKQTKVDGTHGPVDMKIWRGTVMIVTTDSRSSYITPPTLRLFSQPMDLLPPPPVEISGEEGVQLAPEYVDPTAGLMKVGRDGRPLYVKPVDHLEEEVDLSFVESDDGIYEMSPSMIDYSSEASKQPIPSNRIHSVDGETAEVYRDISGVRLYADAARDVTFWRFSLEIELSSTQQRIAYRINQGPALGFWVPAAGQSMNIMFHSGNGFGPSVDSNQLCGPDPLWRDVLNEHQTRPFHVMIGGGDQIFNDSIVTDSPHFQEWMQIKNVTERNDTPLNPDFRSELEEFYLDNYSRWFSQGLFSLANSQIPMVNIWNDHEIFEGFGSYHHDFMQSFVISGLGKIAFKYYLLFQHHSVPEETETDEPSWLLGAQPGPYIEQQSRNLFMSLGHGVTFLGLDCRTERMNNEVLNESTCDRVWDRCQGEIMRGETKHLIVLSSVPVAYPRVAMLKNFMNNRKSLGKSGMLGGLINRSGGNVELFDDHWTAKNLKSERTWLVEDLQDLAAEKSVRVTILSGDVHLAAIGQFHSSSKLGIAKDRDYRYMPNVISSAIADIPETELVSDMLNKRSTVHHMDSNTDEDIIPIFTQDVNGKPRNNKRLLPRRNWCSIREYHPGFTPPATPEPMTPLTEPRPGMLQRTLSLGRGGDRDKSSNKPGGGLLRRLSNRAGGGPPTRSFSFGPGGKRRASVDSPLRPRENGDSYFPGGDQPPPRPGPFHRRPSNLGRKPSKKKNKIEDDGAGAFIDLEGGLAITLNLEVSPMDPSGITIPYKLLVPVLRYQGNEYDPPPTQVVKGWKKWLKVQRKNEAEADASEDELDDDDDDLINNTRANAANHAGGSRDYGV